MYLYALKNTECPRS